MVPSLFGTVISNNMISAMARKAAAQGEVAKIWTRLTLIIAVLIAPLAVSGTGIVELLFGANFAEAGLQFSWLSAGAAGFLIFHAQMGQLMVQRAPILGQLATVPVAGAAIAAYLIGANAAGPTGVAIGQALVAFTAASFSLIWLFKEPSAIGRNFVLLSSCAIAAVAGVATVKAVEGYVTAPVDLLAGLLVSICALWISQVVGENDVKFALRSFGLAR